MTYELVNLTGEAKRAFNFEDTAETAEIRRTTRGFDHERDIRRNPKPGTGTKDDPRCFSLQQKHKKPLESTEEALRKQCQIIENL